MTSDHGPGVYRHGGYSYIPECHSLHTHNFCVDLDFDQDDDVMSCSSCVVRCASVEASMYTSDVNFYIHFDCRIDRWRTVDSKKDIIEFRNSVSHQLTTVDLNCLRLVNDVFES